MNEFKPNWVSPPSDTIKDILEERNITLEEFIKQLNIEEIIANKLLEGKWRITREIAIKLAEILGSTVQFWIRRDRQYQQGLKRLQKK